MCVVATISIRICLDSLDFEAELTFHFQVNVPQFRTSLGRVLSWENWKCSCSCVAVLPQQTETSVPVGAFLSSTKGLSIGEVDVLTEHH